MHLGLRTAVAAALALGLGVAPFTDARAADPLEVNALLPMTGQTAFYGQAIAKSLTVEESAINAADTFIRENPTNPRVDYAYYMKGLVYFERQSNWLERRFNVDLSQRPPINAKKSFDSFQQLIEKFPHSQYVGDAQQRMIYLRNRLADFELHVALYYMRRGAYVGALNRAKYCVENYDGAPAVKDSLKVIVNAYYDLNMIDLAKNAESVYAANYPGSTKDIERKKAWYRRIF